MAKKVWIGIVLGMITLSLVVFIQGESVDKEAVTDSPKEVAIAQKKEATTLPGDLNDWALLLVNNEHKITEEPSNLVELPNGKQIDERIEGQFNDLLKGASEAGFNLTVISGFRSIAEQEIIVQRDTESYLNQGFSEAEAKEKAMAYLTVPGLSEHHTGLALDVLDQDWYNQGNTLEEAFGETSAGKWLDENACHYGFVIRYLPGKEEITGINYEPWHIRYVGQENAEYMKKHNLVLEEYIEQLKK